MKNIFKRMFLCLLIVPCFMLGFTACGEKDKEINVSTVTELKTAIENAKEDETIVLENDLTFTETIYVNRKITLDLNQKTIKNTQDIWETGKTDVKDDEQWSLISVRKNGDLTITGNGKMLAKEGDCYALDVNGGKLTIKNGEFVGGDYIGFDPSATSSEVPYPHNFVKAGYKAQKVGNTNNYIVVKE